MYKAAYCLNQISRYEEAITRYTNFVTKFPTSKYVTAAYFDMGAVYARQKDYDNARVNYELAIQNTNDEDVQSEIQTAIGRTYYDEEDYANAIVAYATLLENYPTSQFISEAKLGIADSHFKLSSWSEASVAYQRVLDEHADQSDLVPYVTFQLGETHYKFASSLKETGQADSATKTWKYRLDGIRKLIMIIQLIPSLLTLFMVQYGLSMILIEKRNSNKLQESLLIKIERILNWISWQRKFS